MLKPPDMKILHILYLHRPSEFPIESKDFISPFQFSLEKLLCTFSPVDTVDFRITVYQTSLLSVLPIKVHLPYASKNSTSYEISSHWCISILIYLKGTFHITVIDEKLVVFFWQIEDEHKGKSVQTKRSD